MLLMYVTAILAAVGYFILSPTPAEPYTTGTHSGIYKNETPGVFNFTEPTECGGEMLAKYYSAMQACTVRDTTVKLPIPDGAIEVFPTEVIVPRCSGHCGGFSFYHGCLPKNNTIELKKYPVMLTDPRFSDKQCSEVSVEVHTECECGCPFNCNEDIHDFNPYNCQCSCKDTQAESACLIYEDKYWDANICACLCLVKEKECSTNYEYDPIKSCKCVRDTETPLNFGGIGTMSALLLIIVVLLAAVIALILKNRALRAANLAEKQKNNPKGQRHKHNNYNASSNNNSESANNSFDIQYSAVSQSEAQTWPES